jgi:hypothetical protein
MAIIAVVHVGEVVAWEEEQRQRSAQSRVKVTLNLMSHPLDFSVSESLLMSSRWNE